MRTPRPRRTTPDSGCRVPASTPSSVDLPEPLMPTTRGGRRSTTVTDRSSNSGPAGPRHGDLPGVDQDHRAKVRSGGGPVEGRARAIRAAATVRDPRIRGPR